MKNHLNINRFIKLTLSGLFIALVAVFLLFSPSSFAVEQPRSLATDSRVTVVAYQKNNVVFVKASTFITTQIVFGHNEVIENIQNGDLDAWTVSVQKGVPYMLFLKPTIVDSKTNMTIVTNRHTYYFQLDSGMRSSKLPDNSMYAIHFIYPEQARRTLLANVRYNQAQKRAILNAHKNPQSYHWNYSFSGAHSIMPLHIFDDGRFTYMQLQLGQTVPAIFAVDNASGKESVVNYRRRGPYIIVQQIAPQFTLRSGQFQVASVFNNRLIHLLRVHGEG